MARYDVVAIGNAIMDLLVAVDDGAIETFGLTRGAMTLLDDETSDRLTAAAGAVAGVSGGSAANTAVGLVSLGARAALVATVAKDALGEGYIEDLARASVAFAGPAPLEGGLGTGRCLVLVSPDGERSMGTYLGASGQLRREHLDASVLASAGVVYLEGYLCDAPDGEELLRESARLAREGGAAVALTLSDAFCVQRHRELLLELAGDADIVFANEAEASLLSGASELEDTIAFCAGLGGVSVVTLGAAGSVILEGDERVAVPAEPVDAVVDLTGAGDLFAAGFLFGWTRSAPLAQCGRLGAIAAAEIIGHLGARPQRPLSAMIEGISLPCDEPGPRPDVADLA